MKYTDDLKFGYKVLWDSMQYNNADKEKAAKDIALKIIKNRQRYENVIIVARKKYPKISIPWYFIGVVHLMECNLSFNHHLHNGDPLSRRTTHVPAGRPVAGNPPFTFVDSAIDALYITGCIGEQDWSISKMLYRLEGYNGYGYTLYRRMNSPYLWAGSKHYFKGKYVADGKFDPNHVSSQIGVALVLKQIFKILG